MFWKNGWYAVSGIFTSPCIYYTTLICIYEASFYPNITASCPRLILDNINHGDFTGDLAKCFDTIYHELLLHKLGKYGLTETELLWFSNYLSERSQIVNINSQYSSPKLIKTGVPQGSILGPLAFLLFINDFASCLSNATCNIFADDNMVYVNGTSVAEVETLLQKSVDEMV